MKLNPYKLCVDVVGDKNVLELLYKDTTLLTYPDYEKCFRPVQEDCFNLWRVLIYEKEEFHETNHNNSV